MRRNRSAARVRAGMTAVAPAVLATALTAYAGVDYRTWGNYRQSGASQGYDVSDSDTTNLLYSTSPAYTGLPMGFSLLAGDSYAASSVHAGVDDLKLGMSAWAVSTRQNTSLADAMVTASAANRITVGAGNSGLAQGDLTRLRLTVRLDGRLYADGTSWSPGGANGEGTGELRANLTIRDPALRTDTGEGWVVSTLASVGASAQIEAYDVYAPYWNYSYYDSWQEDWSYRSNVVASTTHSDGADRKETGEGVAYWTAHTLDTGLLRVEFDALVGDTLEISADLYTYVTAHGAGQASAEFGSTFAFSVTPAGDPVALAWEVPVTPVVPEPASLALLAAGGIALLGRRRT